MIEFTDYDFTVLETQYSGYVKALRNPDRETPVMRALLEWLLYRDVEISSVTSDYIVTLIKRFFSEPSFSLEVIGYMSTNDRWLLVAGYIPESLLLYKYLEYNTYESRHRVFNLLHPEACKTFLSLHNIVDDQCKVYCPENYQDLYDDIVELSLYLQFIRGKK